MEPRMEMKETKWVETMIHNGTEHGVRFLRAREQLYTRSCARCAGLLVHDWCYDLIDSGEHNAEVFRCVQSGHRVDPVILRNQVRPLVERTPHRPVRINTP